MKGDVAGNNARTNNMGVTKPKQKHNKSYLSVCLDWFSFTLFDNENEAWSLKVEKVLGVQLNTFMPGKARYGYRKCSEHGGITILYGSSDEMGVHIRISGQGCRQLESIMKDNNKSWVDIFVEVMNYKGKICRIDVALDEQCYGKRPRFAPKKLFKLAEKGLLTSRFKSITGTKSLKIASGSNLGETVYFGKRTSDVCIRCYDKLKEQEYKGIQLEIGLTNHTRMELELTSSHATEFVTLLVNGATLGQLTSSILEVYLDFKAPPSPTKTANIRKTRLQTAKFWNKLLDDVRLLELTTFPDPRNH